MDETKKAAKSVAVGTAPAKADYLSLALRVGLADHPGFAGAIHQRLVLDCLYETPTQRLSTQEVIDWIAAHYDGLRLTTQQATAALTNLSGKPGWVVVQPEERSGTKRYGLSPNGQTDWSKARADGTALEERVRDEFLREIGAAGQANAQARWQDVITELDRIFCDEAYALARVFLDQGHFADVVQHRKHEKDGDAGTAAQDVSEFLRGAKGDRTLFLRRLLHGALAFHLFRASPDADEAIQAHLRGRTFYLDTTVLYAILARQGDLAGLRDDLLRVVRELDCRLRVTTDTLAEFHASVAHYKKLLHRDGIPSAAMARAVLSRQAIEDLDDYRRGYYQQLLSDQATTVELYTLPYDTIEERLADWGIPKPEALPIQAATGPHGKLLEIDNASAFIDSLTTFLTDHPRKGRAASPWNDDGRRIYHDAVHVALVQKLREVKGVKVPVRPSQVSFWFLTRDRKVCDWDRSFLAESGGGSVPRCMGLEQWIESVAVFVPSLRQTAAADTAALRLLALHSHPLRAGDEPSVEQLQAIGRNAEILNLHPEESARIAADGAVLRQLQIATNAQERMRIVKDSALRGREQEISALQASLTTVRTEARAGVAKKLADLERERNQLKDTQPDADLGRRVRQRWGWVAVWVLAIGFGLVLLASRTPVFWTSAGWLRKVLFIGAGSSLIVTGVLWILGMRGTVRRFLSIVTLVGGALASALDLWVQSKADEVPPPAHAVSSDSTPHPEQPKGAPAAQRKP